MQPLYPSSSTATTLWIQGTYLNTAAAKAPGTHKKQRTFLFFSACPTRTARPSAAAEEHRLAQEMRVPRVSPAWKCLPLGQLGLPKDQPLLSPT